MNFNRSVASDISYANSADGRMARRMIRGIENLTGRPALIRRADGYDVDIERGGNFWQVIAQRYAIEYDFIKGSPQNIPTEGPLVVVANHPFGILDGLAMGNLLAERRDDFQIIANNVFQRASEIDRFILPISFESTRQGAKVNLETRRIAVRNLRAGGAVAVFPGGTVSTASRPMGAARDPQWRNFTAKIISESQATVLPVYFDGSNSRLFQMASHLHQHLRVALLIREFKRSIRRPVRIAIGQPITPENLTGYAQKPAELMDYLRGETYRLGGAGQADLDYGYDFDSTYTRRGPA
ncbi:hypothetical protein GCM10007939_06830 [Amylibacter marinus]|uniref:Phospholipid/glycerol acyltransferase domain-containing protein n=1 Tax=Amylibacter marinus TaxID=1475483 RepID=A0ABQ5VSJ6_9RHOB|nr:lysophospholipid acyltransferase family protein [Amylibacter marinus]GLQ34400.1 hypothetical protein GCM10007939_06830 [Amylibacter marinus]